MKVSEPVEKNQAGRPKKSKQGRRRINRYPSQGEKIVVSENAGNVVVDDITEKHALGDIKTLDFMLFLFLSLKL